MPEIRLLIDKVRLALKKRINAKSHTSKSYAWWLAKGYNNTPEATIVLESHNKSLQIIHVVKMLRKNPRLEIIVIDDGSDLEHTRRLTEFLTGANEFLIRANDLYENIMYNKTIRFASAPYIALLQDDDQFDSLDWITEALQLFQQHPQMAILGGCDALDMQFDDDKHFANGKPYPHSEGFSFVPTVNRAPMWINKQLFTEYLHNIDYNYAPFQMDDYELCLRAWLNGLQVGWYDARFRSLSVGGMRLWNNAFTREQGQRNGARLYETYKDKMPEVYSQIPHSNP